MKGKRSKKSHKYSKFCKRNKTKKQHGHGPGNTILQISPDYIKNSSKSISITDEQLLLPHGEEFIYVIMKERKRWGNMVDKIKQNSKEINITKVDKDKIFEYYSLYSDILTVLRNVPFNKGPGHDPTTYPTIKLPYVLFLHVHDVYNGTIRKTLTIGTNLESSTNA